MEQGWLTSVRLVLGLCLAFSKTLDPSDLKLGGVYAGIVWSLGLGGLYSNLVSSGNS